MTEFKGFPKIARLDTLSMTITQKMHGTNAQILITDDGQIFSGNRYRWLSIDDDNYGFASFVDRNREELLAKLPVGRHYGEWCGGKINSGEGLKEKTLFLFNHSKFANRELPTNVRVIPVLISDVGFCEENIFTYVEWLKENGSLAVPGFMKIEGIVIEIKAAYGDPMYLKYVFGKEETGWTGVKRERTTQLDMFVDVSHLLQPMRLEKLLSRDEKYVREYPQSLSSIAKDYVADLESENQLALDEDELKKVKKSLGKKLFPFIKQHILDQKNAIQNN